MFRNWIKDIGILCFFISVLGPGSICAQSVPQASPPTPNIGREVPLRARFETIKLSCGAGDNNACGELANRYRVGMGVPVDFERANQLAEQACAAQSGVGCGILAILAERGQGIAVNQARANALYQQSCDTGYVPSCTNLGTNTKSEER